ncbi:ribonuclease-like [Carettochelys insculpta]|uniref:ribonuclease-like n=1 Tax=Carettochelys insculpta TaxID=44489 RepID=UPI003EB7A90A
MAPWGPSPTLLLLLVVLVTGLAQLGAAQFVDYPRTEVSGSNQYCNYMMQLRGLTTPECKSVHTFIHAAESEVQSLCDSGGNPQGNNIYISKKPLPSTTCKLESGSKPEACTYQIKMNDNFSRATCVNKQVTDVQTTDKITSMAPSAPSPTLLLLLVVLVAGLAQLGAVHVADAPGSQVSGSRVH